MHKYHILHFLLVHHRLISCLLSTLSVKSWLQSIAIFMWAKSQSSCNRGKTRRFIYYLMHSIRLQEHSRESGALVTDCMCNEPDSKVKKTATPLAQIQRNASHWHIGVFLSLSLSQTIMNSETPWISQAFSNYQQWQVCPLSCSWLPQASS